MRKKLILDLDTGIDDALAIAYALGSADEIDLIGITATYGNVAVPLAARNALAVLHLFGRDDVPVYPGVDHPIAPATLPKMRGTTPDERAQAYARWQNGGADGWQTDASWSPTPGSVAVHHPNGIGGAIIPDSPRAPEAPGSAVDFIITAAHEYGPDLTIVPTGAMTTMATVFRNAPDLKDSGVNVTLMGGALTLPGNVSPAAEANISQDPEAADYLFKCGARTTMIGLDVTHQTALTREKAHEWASLGTPAGDFLVTMTDYYIDFYLKNQPEIRGCGLHDPLAVAAALDPSLVTTFGFNLQVDLEGPFRGRTIGDRSRLQDPDKHTQVALGVDVPEFLDRFMGASPRRPGDADGGRPVRSTPWMDMTHGVERPFGNRQNIGGRCMRSAPPYVSDHAAARNQAAGRIEREILLLQIDVGDQGLHERDQRGLFDHILALGILAGYHRLGQTNLEQGLGGGVDHIHHFADHLAGGQSQTVALD